MQRDFDFTIDQINQIFLLTHSVALESYVKAFQYKVIIFIQIPNYVKLVTETTICVRFVKLSQKPQIIFFITVPTLDNSGQILHHTGTYYQSNKSTSL